MTPTPSTGGDARADLLERLKAATGPDRELDAGLCKTLDPKSWAQYRNWAAMPSGAPEETVERDAARYAKPYTSSLDAALALVERILPGWQRDIRELEPRNWMAFVSRTSPSYRLESGIATTAPLAVLIALLSALPADSLGQEETGK